MNPPTTISRASRLAAAGLLALLACSCASAPADPTIALDQKRSEAVSLAARARKAQEAGKRREAVELYLQSLDVYDQVPGVRTNLGMAVIQSGDIMKGSDLLKEEVQLFPANAHAALTNLGLIYNDARQFTVARDYFFRALELYPNDPLALRGAVESCMATDYDEERTLALILRGLMVERDPKVLEDYKWRQIRLEARIKERPKYKAGEDFLRPKYEKMPKAPARAPDPSPADAPAETPPQAPKHPA